MKYWSSIPHLNLGMLAGTIYHLSFAYALECIHYRPILISLEAFQCCPHGFDVLGAICRINSLITPADLGMTPQIAGRPGITLVKEPTNEACLAATRGCRTFKDMGLAALDVLNGREGLEECVDR